MYYHYTNGPRQNCPGNFGKHETCILYNEVSMFRKTIKLIGVFLLALVWFLTGWPGIGVQNADAASCSSATLGTGTDPGSSTIAPGSGIVTAGQFTITGSGTSCAATVTALTVTLATTGTPYAGLAEVRITSSNDATTYFSAVTSFSSNSVNFSGGTAIPIAKSSTGAVPFNIRITPLSATGMPVPPGALYALSPRVSAWTTTLTKSGSDSNSNTTTIDNLSPNGATGVSGASGVGSATLNWTTSSSSDFNSSSGSVVLRWTGSSAGSEVPQEGTTYSAGNTITTATVACVISSGGSTALSKIDGVGGSAGCTTTALTGGQSYTYKVFQEDSSGNYDVGVLIGTVTPTTVVVSVTISANGTISYGYVAPGGNKNTSSAGMNTTPVAQNNGNVAEDFSIAGTNSANWTLGASAGNETYAHMFCTSGCTTPPTNYTALTTGNQSLATNIGVNGTQSFDLAVYVPTATSNYSQQSVNVTITASQH